MCVCVCLSFSVFSCLFTCQFVSKLCLFAHLHDGGQCSQNDEHTVWIVPREGACWGGGGGQQVHRQTVRTKVRYPRPFVCERWAWPGQHWEAHGSWWCQSAPLMVTGTVLSAVCWLRIASSALPSSLLLQVALWLISRVHCHCRVNGLQSWAWQNTAAGERCNWHRWTAAAAALAVLWDSPWKAPESRRLAQWAVRALKEGEKKRKERR